MKIVHIITTLEEGGAEKSLYNLLLFEKKHSHYVISLKKGGFFYKKFRKANIKVFEFDLNNIFKFLMNFFLLFFFIRKINPDVVQTWMYHSNLIGGIIAKLLGVKKIIWSIRGCYEKKLMSFRTIVVVKLNSILSFYIPDFIIINSNYAKESLKQIGFKKNIIQIIHNGFKLNKTKVTQKRKETFYLKHNISIKTVVFSMVARYDNLKDHNTLFQSLRLLKMNNKNILFKCILVGKNIDNENKKINYLIDKYELNNEIILLGNVDDIDFIFSIVDLNILSSLSESFPNVIAESMLNKTPCISTKVGDIEEIIGNNGWIVDCKNYQKLYSIILESISLMNKREKWKDLKNKCYFHIVKNFEFEKMQKKYLNIWESK